MGDLSGITDYNFSDGVTGYGIYTSNGYFKGKIEVSSQATAPSSDGLIGYYPLQGYSLDESGSKITLDLSGHGYHSSGSLALIDPENFTSGSGAGPTGGALNFDGNSTVVHITHMTQSFTSNMDISVAWWQRQTGAADQYAAFHFSDNDNNEFALFGDNLNNEGQFRLLDNNAEAGIINIDTSVLPIKNTWRHLCVTAPDNGSGSLYIDGVHKGYFTSSLVNFDATDVDQILIGADADSTPPQINDYFEGQMSEFRFYNKVLTDQEVQSLFLSPSAVGGRTIIEGNRLTTGQIRSNNWGPSYGSEYNLNDGTFRLGGASNPKLEFDGTDLIVSGTIQALAGEIGGFTISTDAISGTNLFISGSPTVGGTNNPKNMFISTSRFNLKENGDITGSQVLFDGGTIGGWAVTGNDLVSSTNAAATRLKLDAANNTMGYQKANATTDTVNLGSSTIQTYNGSNYIARTFTGLQVKTGTADLNTTNANPDGIFMVSSSHTTDTPTAAQAAMDTFRVITPSWDYQVTGLTQAPPMFDSWPSHHYHKINQSGSMVYGAGLFANSITHFEDTRGKLNGPKVSAGQSNGYIINDYQRIESATDPLTNWAAAYYAHVDVSASIQDTKAFSFYGGKGRLYNEDEIRGNDGLYAKGTISASGNVYAGTVASPGNVYGTIATAAQTNITSVGTLDSLTVTGDINANGNIDGDGSTNITDINKLEIGTDIEHDGDTDTKISFSTDQIDLWAGGKQFLTCDETTQDILVINEGSQDIDFRVEGNGDTHAIFMRASDDLVGIGTSAPLAKLDITRDNGIAQTTVLAIRASDPNGDQTVSLTADMDFHIWDSNTQLTTPQARIGIVGSSTTTQNAEAGGRLAFYTNIENYASPSLTERMRIDPSGNVGIGTDDPDCRLHVKETAGGSTTGIALESGDSAGIYMHFMNYTSGGTPGTDGFRIGIDDSEDFVIYDEEKNKTAFKIDSGAGDRVYFKATSTSTVFQILNEYTDVSADVLRLKTGVTGDEGASSGYYIFCQTSHGDYASYFQGGLRGITGAQGIAIYSNSDARLKNNIRDTVKGLDLLLQIPVRDFEWKNNPGVVCSGWVAQEVEDLVPEAVADPTERNTIKGLKEGDDEYEYKTMQQDSFIPIMMKAIQEQNSLILGLEKRIKELEEK